MHERRIRNRRRLVALDAADEVPRDRGSEIGERGALREPFLHVVLAEGAEPDRRRRPYDVGIHPLADADERHVRACAAGVAARRSDAFFDGGEVARDRRAAVVLCRMIFQRTFHRRSQPATSGNKSAAIAWVNGPATNPGGGTPTYACLKTACQVYPVDLGKMFLLTDGSPNVSGSASQILADFPAWWTHFTDCTLVCICIGGVGSAQTFMQQLAALAGGIYVQR